MTESFPIFKYHPSPLTTGMVKASSIECACCHRVRGFLYVGPVYGEQDLHESLCPWCIADGTAAAKLGASFADDFPLRKAGLSEEIIEEINLRTPAYSSWQQEEWLTHCDDACEYHGDAAVDDVLNASEATKLAWRQRYNFAEAEWSNITKAYSPRGDQAFYKFVCRHCGAVLLGWDCS